MSPKRVLLVDSYDSFTDNVAHLLASLGAHLDILSIDDPHLGVERLRDYDAIVLGPGPGAPREGDRLAEIVTWTLHVQRPLLGICLGMQAIARHYGARIIRAPRPVHGELSTIVHDGLGLFAGIPSPLRGMRYHSLCVEQKTVPPSLRANALSEDGVVQGIVGVSHSVWGLQFHPESFLSEHGGSLLANFLATVRHHRIAAAGNERAKPYAPHG
jgi:anthranilate synthase/aminodeoxychorismate synthase-like glutamine amidotransferase